MGYRAYADYKDSGVEWLGKIPSHWDQCPVKRKFLIANGSTPKSGETEFWDGDILWITPADFSRASSGYLGESARTITDAGLASCGTRLVPSNSIVISVRAPIGEVVQAASELCTNQGCKSLVKDAPEIHERFFFYVFSCSSKQLNALGLGTTFMELSTHVLGQYRVPLPPLKEQKKISRFVDHKTAQIDRLIEKKQELIEKLQEQRITAITQAVTKGLNNDVALKDSGVEWLGEIPKHWKVATLRRYISNIEQGWSPSCEDRPANLDEWAILKSGCVNGGIFRDSEHKTLPQDLEPPQGLEVRPEDILMCRASGSKHLIGSIAKIKTCRPKLIFSDKTYRITVDRSYLNPDFFALAMRAKYLREQIELSISGAEGLANNIPQSLIKAYIYAAPPLEEQNHIVAWLELFSLKTELQEQAINEAIARLQEYRTALITAAVTGQIDVRDWQAPASTQDLKADKDVA